MDIAGKLTEELESKTAFTIPILGGIPVPESCVVTWIIIAALALLSIIFESTVLKHDANPQAAANKRCV